MEDCVATDSGVKLKKLVKRLVKFKEIGVRSKEQRVRSHMTESNGHQMVGDVRSKEQEFLNHRK